MDKSLETLKAFEEWKISKMKKNLNWGGYKKGML